MVKRKSTQLTHLRYARGSFSDEDIGLFFKALIRSFCFSLCLDKENTEEHCYKKPKSCKQERSVMNAMKNNHRYPCVLWLILHRCFFPHTLDFHCANFLGGLSLHLNHLIQSCMEISHWLFGTLPIGLLLSNLDSRQLETSPMTSYDQF